MNSLLSRFRDNLCKLSGEDYTFINKCKSRKIKNYFSFIGFFVLLILLFCFLSAVYFTEHLFHNVILDFGVGILWGYIVTNMYVLLLYTITPTLLPIKDKKQNKKSEKTFRFRLSFSMRVRIFLILIIAVIIAQPLNVFLLKPESNAFAQDIKYLLGNNPLASIITLMMLGVFLIPVYLKYSIRKLGEFYEVKGDIKKRIIEDHYKEFKQEYKLLLEGKISEYNKKAWENLMPLLNRLERINPTLYQNHYNEIQKELYFDPIEKYEYWSNPPYRTISKSDYSKYLTEQDLLTLIYSQGK